MATETRRGGWTPGLRGAALAAIALLARPFVVPAFSSGYGGLREDPDRVWTYRFHYAVWRIVSGGLGSAPDSSGIFDRIQIFAFYVPWLVALEIYFRARRRQSPVRVRSPVHLPGRVRARRAGRTGLGALRGKGLPSGALRA